MQFSQHVVHIGSVGLDWQHIGTILITMAAISMLGFRLIVLVERLLIAWRTPS